MRAWTVSLKWRVFDHFKKLAFAAAVSLPVNAKPYLLAGKHVFYHALFIRIFSANDTLVRKSYLFNRACVFLSFFHIILLIRKKM
jgi:hypothetical protein